MRYKRYEGGGVRRSLSEVPIPDIMPTDYSCFIASPDGNAGANTGGNVVGRSREPRRPTAPAQQEALEDLRQSPNDSAAKGAAEMQLRKALNADDTLARDLAALLPAAQNEARPFLRITGDNNIAVQAVGSTVTIGNTGGTGRS